MLLHKTTIRSHGCFSCNIRLDSHTQRKRKNSSECELITNITLHTDAQTQNRHVVSLNDSMTKM